MPKIKGKALGFFKQDLGRIPLKPGYWAEVGALNLGIKDDNGDIITFYRTDYMTLIKKLELKVGSDPENSYNTALKKYVEDNQLDFSKLKSLVKEINTKRQPNEFDIQLVKYFSTKSLNDCRIKEGLNFSSESDVVDTAGRSLKKNKHQNCVVMVGNEIYIHPKIRANIASDIVGVNHSSLSGKQQVAFAGSFVYDKKIGWIIENSSGHYGTSVLQMRQFLKKLSEKANLDDLTVKFLIPMPYKPGVEIKGEEFEVLQENANDFLKRTEQSFKAMEERATTKPRVTQKESNHEEEIGPQEESDQEKLQGPSSDNFPDDEEKPQGPSV